MATDVLVEVVPVVVLHSGVVERCRHQLEPRSQRCGVRGQTAQLVGVGQLIGRIVTPVHLTIIEAINHTIITGVQALFLFS